ncbi:isochorismatase domain-containing protein 1-like protein [Neoconidiobolus thromboides FSU 785]|nr:isochorismatase domain-containing protein 1-like protein [Neoconidiobolus thromboides FSU 785]
MLAKNLAKINPKTSAFLVCDIQERFRSTIFGYQGVINTAKKLVSAAEILESPVIVTEQYPKALGNTVKELDVSKARLIQAKTKFSMVTPEVLEQLKGIESVIIFGIESHVCVLQSCLDLLRKDFDVRVIADGVSSSNKFEIPIALQRMRSAGAVITTSESILFELMGDAKEPKFKAISNLVKEYQEVSKSNPLVTNFTSSL